MAENKKFENKNIKVTGLYLKKNGKDAWSPDLNEAQVSALMAASDVGIKFHLRKNEFKKEDTHPDYFLEIITAEEVQKFKNRKPTDDI